MKRSQPADYKFSLTSTELQLFFRGQFMFQTSRFIYSNSSGIGEELLCWYDDSTINIHKRIQKLFKERVIYGLTISQAETQYSGFPETFWKKFTLCLLRLQILNTKRT